MKSTNDAVIGFDLGTGTCLVSLLEADRRVTILPTLSGETMVPSVVYFETDGTVLVGGPAYNLLLANPERGVMNVKRCMGMCDSQNNPIPAILHPDTKQPLSAQEVACHLIRQMLQSIEADYQLKIAGVCATVPAYFSDPQKLATRQAFEMAGYTVLHLVHEPTAAAVAFGLDKKEDGTFLFVDSGQGTTDVTVLRAEKNDFRVLATKGNCELGGANIDELLVEYALKTFKEKTGKAIDPAKDLEVIYDLRDKLNRAKRDLSSVEKVTVTISANGKRLALPITRDQFNQMIHPLVQQMLKLTEETLSAAGLNWPAITEVVLVGGTTYIPYLREQLEVVAGKPPRTDINPLHAVVQGAALLARQTAGELPGITPKDTSGRLVPGFTATIVDVNSHPLGVLAYDRTKGTDQLFNMVMIPANTPLPARKEDRFELVDPRQTQARITIVQGPQDAAENECIKIGEIILDNLPPNPDTNRIVIHYAYNVDGILEVTATDTLSGLSTNGRIDHRAGLLNAPGT
jgi:molecular chaperone DnaK